MTKRKLIKAAIWSFSILLVLVITLAVHIYIVTRPKIDDPRIRQLSRIDFFVKPDSVQANQIKSEVLHMKGVDAAYFNVPDGILVYSYNPNDQNSVQVYLDLMKKGGYKAKRYVVDAAALAKGCPVLDKSTLTYRLGAFFQKLFS